MSRPASPVAGTSANLVPSTLRHEIVNRNTNIPKFTGTDTGPDLESWIKSVDDHLNAQPRLSSLEQLIEAKLHLSTARAKQDDQPTHVSYIIPDTEFEQLRTWPELQAFLRQFYSPVSRDNVVTSLTKILRDLEKEHNRHYLAYSSQVLTKLTGWKALMRGSDWDNNGYLDINTVANLLHLTLVLKHLPSQLVDHFKPDWVPGDATGKINVRVRKHMGKLNSEISMSRILDDTSKNESKQTVAVVTQPRPSQTTHKGRLCHNCQKGNHIARQCRAPPFCTYHGIVGHRNDQCRAQSKNQGQHNNNQGNQPHYQNKGGNVNQRNVRGSFNNSNYRNSQPRGYYNTSGRNHQPNTQPRSYHNRSANNNMGMMQHNAGDMNQYMPNQQTTSASTYVPNQTNNGQQSSSVPVLPQQNFRQRIPPTPSQT